MAEAIKRAVALVQGMSADQFFSDERTQWAVSSQVVILGEAASRVSRDFQNAHPEIPWSDAIGMRHRLIHGYDAIDWPRVWATLVNDLPPMLDKLTALLPTEGKTNETN